MLLLLSLLLLSLAPHALPRTGVPRCQLPIGNKHTESLLLFYYLQQIALLIFSFSLRFMSSFIDRCIK